MELLNYNPDNGKFINLTDRTANNSLAGQEAGRSRPDGYRVLNVDGSRYYAHRLSWLYCHGRFPDGFIDHIDGNPANNKLSNLREATRSNNQANRGSQNGRLYPKNVHWNKRAKKWAVNIGHQGKLHYFGLYSSVAEAEAVAKSNRKKLHGEFAR